MTGGEFGLSLGDEHRKIPPFSMDLADLSWPAVAALPRATPVVIPIAALEQHGHHLPLFTDSLLLGEVVRRMREDMGGEALFAPLTWLGNSHHHLGKPGTLSAEPRTYLDLLSGLARNFIGHGFRRLLFLNGHGGNDVPARQVVFELRQEHRSMEGLLLLAATYWNLASPPSEPGLHQREMGHACEWETSMMLVIAPHLVQGHERAGGIAPGGGFEPAARGWTMADRSEPGHIGWPALATREKGEALIRAFSRGGVALVRRMAAWDGKSWDAPEARP